jgi:hypothetical protein
MSVTMKVVRGKPQGSYLWFPDGHFVLGRGPECNVRPNSESISRQHCSVTVNGRLVLVRDLGSTNGTFVNGKRITDERLLNIGDTLQMSSLVLEVIQLIGWDQGDPITGIWRWEDIAYEFPPALGQRPGDPGIPVRPPGAHPAYPADTPIPGSLRARQI